MDTFGALLPILLIGVVFYLLVMRPARNRQRQQQELLNTLVPGSRIMTTAGVFGVVTAVEDDEVNVEIAPGVEIRMVKAAVGRVIADEPTPEPAERPDGEHTAS